MNFFLIIAFVLTWLAILNLLNSISGSLSSKKTYYRTLTKKEKKNGIVSRVNATASFLKLIDTMVAIEIESLIDSLRLIHQPYNVLNLDKDIKNISESIFNAIKKDLYEDDELCIESDFLLEFITVQVTNRFTETVISSNIGIYAEKANDSE